MSIKDEFKRGWQRDVNALLDAWDARARTSSGPARSSASGIEIVRLGRSGMKTGSIILGLYGCARIYINEQAKNNPPASCQLLGGHWDIWKGWRC